MTALRIDAVDRPRPGWLCNGYSQLSSERPIQRGGYLARQVGEHLVVSELGRRGICATTFAGNVPEFDILASRNGRSIAIQVKTARSGSWHLNAGRFLNIALANEIQSVGGIRPELDSGLLYFFVRLGPGAGQDRLFMITQGALAELIERHHTAYLEKHGGRRPRAPESLHSAINEAQLAPWRDNWPLVEESLSSAPTQPMLTKP